jgi:hypothetical protein
MRDIYHSESSGGRVLSIPRRPVGFLVPGCQNPYSLPKSTQAGTSNPSIFGFAALRRGIRATR